MVLLKADPFPSRWCVTCARHADAILLVAAAEDDKAPGPHEGHALQARLLGGVHGGGLAQRELVLLHNSTEVTPTGTRPWLEAFSVHRHHHAARAPAHGLAPAHAARLARSLRRQSVGLVLAGGGARGFAHVGVLMALEEEGVPVDLLGGTSMGGFLLFSVRAIGLTSCFVHRLLCWGFIRQGTHRVVDPHHRAASCGAHVFHVEPTDGPHDPGRELLQRVSHEQSAGTSVQGREDRGLLAAVFLHDARPGELRAHRAQERDAVEVRPCVHGARGVPPAAVRLGAEGGGGRGGNRSVVPAYILGWKNFRKRRPDLVGQT